MRRNFWRAVVRGGARGELVGLVALALMGGVAARPELVSGAGLAARNVVVAAGARHGRDGKKRLILKDGTYLDVTRFRVRDGQVRYRRREGGRWREIPAARVDWAATKHWERERPHGVTGGDGATGGEGGFENISPAAARREAAELDREEQARRAAVNDLMPVVKPGLRLPDEGGIFVLDEYHGQPEIVHLRQADGDLNQHPFHSVQAVDVDRMHAFAGVVRMRGLKAAVQLHTGKPVFYVSLRGGVLTAPADAFVVNTAGDSGKGDSGQGDSGKRDSGKETDGGGGSAKSRFVVVRVVRQGGSRVIFARQLRAAEKPDAGGDRPETMENDTTEKRMADGHWMKVRPANALEPGEYALVEVLGPEEVNRDVWDFGVNPEAPENAGARLPVKSGR